MNTINKFYIRNSKRTFLLMLWLLSLSSAIGQEQVPERRLSAEQMRRPEIAAIAGRLGQLRRNEAGLVLNILPRKPPRSRFLT